MELFSFLPKTKSVPKIFSYQTKNNVKKIICSRPTGHNYGHPLDRKPFFIMVALESMALILQIGQTLENVGG